MVTPPPFLHRVALFAAASLVSWSSGVAQTAPATASLKDTYKGIFYIGVAVNPAQFTGRDAQAAALIEQQFDCITAENAMKWDAVEPENGVFRFEQADQFVKFGLKNKMFIVGHNLCWHSQLPAWVSKPAPGQNALTKEELTKRLHDHIVTVAGRYKGKVNGWDVVNEAVAEGGGYRDSVFYRVIGKEYLALAFKWAHEAAPDAELYYNDFNLDASDAKRATTIELVKYLKEQGARIDGIGMQGHYNLDNPTAAKIDETIQMFADLGMKVMITELDVQVVRNAAVTGAVGANPGGGERRRGGFPSIEALKTTVTLTDTQVAQISPLLEAHVKNAATAGGDFGKIVESRNATIAAIRALLTEAQVAPFNRLVAPPPGGGFPVGPPPPPLTEAQQQALAKRYGEIFGVFLKHRDAVTRVTLWGLRDADSWRRRSSPLLFDDNYRPKPAFNAVIDAVGLAGAVAKSKIG